MDKTSTAEKNNGEICSNCKFLRAFKMGLRSASACVFNPPTLVGGALPGPDENAPQIVSTLRHLIEIENPKDWWCGRFRRN